MEAFWLDASQPKIAHRHKTCRRKKSAYKYLARLGLIEWVDDYIALVVFTTFDAELLNFAGDGVAADTQTNRGVILATVSMF